MHNSDKFSSRACIESLFKIIEIVFIIAIDNVIIKDASLARIRYHESVFAPLKYNVKD